MSPSSRKDSYDPKDRSFSPLQLYDPRADRGQRYKTLKPGDRFYATAVVAMHAAQQLSLADSRALLYALAEDWPRVSGRTSHSDWRAVRALGHYRNGWSVERLAHAYGYTREVVLRWLKHAEQDLEDEARVGPEPKVIAIDGPVPSLTSFESVRATDTTIARREAVVEAERRLVEHLPKEMREMALAWGPPSPPKHNPPEPGKHTGFVMYGIGLPPERKPATTGRRSNQG